MKSQPSKVYKTDAQLKTDILSELEFEPSVKATVSTAPECIGPRSDDQVDE